MPPLIVDRVGETSDDDVGDDGDRFPPRRRGKDDGCADLRRRVVDPVDRAPRRGTVRVVRTRRRRLAIPPRRRGLRARTEHIRNVPRRHHQDEDADGQTVRIVRFVQGGGGQSRGTGPVRRPHVRIVRDVQKIVARAFPGRQARVRVCVIGDTRGRYRIRMALPFRGREAAAAGGDVRQYDGGDIGDMEGGRIGWILQGVHGRTGAVSLRRPRYI